MVHLRFLPKEGGRVWDPKHRSWGDFDELEEEVELKLEDPQELGARKEDIADQDEQHLVLILSKADHPGETEVIQALGDM